MVHECLKSSLAFRKPAVAAASRRPARADGPKVGLDGPASLGAGRALWPPPRSGGSQQHARGQRRRQTFASPSRVRWSSAVDSTIELACTGVAHKARAALSGLSGRRHGRWCRIRAPSSARTSEPSDLFDPNVTQMCHILTQRALRLFAAGNIIIN